MKILKRIETCTTNEERKAHMSKLHKIVWANIAVNEGDYGTILELGLDIFCSESKYLNSIITQLSTSYKLLRRAAFDTMLKVIIINSQDNLGPSITLTNTIIYLILNFSFHRFMYLQDRIKGGNSRIFVSK